MNSLIAKFAKGSGLKSADNHNLKDTCLLAYSRACNEQKMIQVGATYNGYTIGEFPSVQSVYEVYPNGEVWFNDKYPIDNAEN
jgi:hypothetical protein